MEWQQPRGQHSDNLGGPFPGLPGALGLPAWSKCLSVQWANFLLLCWFSLWCCWAQEWLSWFASWHAWSGVGGGQNGRGSSCNQSLSLMVMRRPVLMPIRPWRGPEGLGPGPEFTPGVWQELGKLCGLRKDLKSCRVHTKAQALGLSQQAARISGGSPAGRWYKARGISGPYIKIETGTSLHESWERKQITQRNKLEWDLKQKSAPWVWAHTGWGGETLGSEGPSSIHHSVLGAGGAEVTEALEKIPVWAGWRTQTQ